MYTMDYMIKIFEYVKDKNATDIHMTAGSTPAMRTGGQLKFMDFDIIYPKDIEHVIDIILDKEQKETLKINRSISSPFVIRNIGRLRANIYMQRSSYAINFKLLDRELKTPEELRLPNAVIDLYKLKSGLVLICGDKDSGKYDTMSAIVKKISSTRECHIITIEDPIGYLYKHDKAIVNQKEVGIDVSSFEEGVCTATKQDPDVIMISSASSPEVFSAALSAAEDGHLVITTLQTTDSISTIEYINGMFPLDRRNNVKIQLSNVLQTIVSQRLIPGKGDDEDRIAFEVMIANQAMRNLIMENKIYQIPSMIKASKSLGMMTMEDSINKINEMKEKDRE